MNEFSFIPIDELASIISKSGLWTDALDPRLSIAKDGSLETFYAPFEYINSDARVTIVGLTPGKTQMRIALNETRLALQQGMSWFQAIELAKSSASFGGPMRTNLVRMLDYIGLHNWLGIDSCASLFSENRSIAHHTSILRYPVLKDGQNYNGQPEIERVPFLRSQVDRWFANEISQLPNSVFIPLGMQVARVFQRLVREHRISDDRCLSGIPHPSGANAERIAYFLGTKAADKLSKQTNGRDIDRIREDLISKVQALSR